MTHDQQHPGENTESYIILVNEREYRFREAIVTGREILEKANLLPIDCHDLYEEIKGHDLRKILPDQEVNIGRPEGSHFVTKEPDIFHYDVDNKHYTTEKNSLTPLEILHKAEIDPHLRYLIQELSDGQRIIYAYKLEENIRLRCPALKFITKEWLPLVDVEEYGKECKEVPPAHKYKIRIDKNYHIVDKPYITGKEVVDLEKKTPAEKFDVFAFFSNRAKPEKVGLLEVFHITQVCFVRFVVQPKEQQDGRGKRREFTLPEDDIIYLNQMGLSWETVKNGGFWLIMYDYPLPAGYQISTAELALMIPPSYAAAEIDMVYFHPDLQRVSGGQIKAISPQNIDGRLFQRWSRHRKAGEWQLGVDNVSTHLLLVDKWLLNELSR